MHAEDNDGVELPKVNEDLRNFFLPRKQVAPEPEPAPEAKCEDVEAATTPTFPGENASCQELRTVPGAMRKVAQAPQPHSPSSAYRPGAFDAVGPAGHSRAAEPSKASRKWFSFSKTSKPSSRLDGEARFPSRFSFCTNPLATEVSVGCPIDGAPLRFSSKHAMGQAFSAPLPLPTATPEEAAPVEANAGEEAAGQLGQEAVTEVPALPEEDLAASIGDAVSGEPVCEAVMAAQELSLLVMPGPAVIDEEAAAPLGATEEPEQEAPVPEAPQPKPIEEAVEAPSADAHASDAALEIEETPAEAGHKQQEEQQPNPGEHVGPAEAGSPAVAEPEAHSNADLHSDAADMAIIPEHTVFEGAAAPVEAADGAATDAAPAEEDGMQEGEANIAAASDNASTATTPKAVEIEKQDALCASPPASPAHEVPISSFYQRGGRKSPPKKQQPPKDGKAKWPKWLSKNT